VTLIAAFVASLAVWAAAPTSTAAAAERCDGVWVVVDAHGAGGSLTSRCARDPATGLDALAEAGHSYSFVPRVPGMVCTIDARPDPCNGAPADAYWSYWTAKAGGSWTYSSTGAGSRVPKAGEVEGWAFGAGAPPRTAPPTNPPPEPEKASEPEPSADAGSGSAPSRTTRPSPSTSTTPAPEPTPRSSRASDTAADTHAATGDGATADGAPASDDADDEPPEGGDAGDEPPEGDDDADAAADPAPSSTPTSRPSPEEAEERGVGADGDRAADDRAPVDPPERDADGEVALSAPGDGGTMTGLVAGGALAATIAGAGAFEVRRRRLAADG
jgi:hypothetical protein